MSSRPAREQRGFTLLEVTIAMMFVAVLVGGIVLSISTCLKVWERAQETADLNQEARAVFAVLARDVRGSYLGLHRTGGYFLGHAGASRESLEGEQELLELTTESSTITGAALLPAEASDPSQLRMAPPVTDFVAVRYGLLRPTSELRGGLYRTVWVAPVAEWLEERPSAGEAMSDELISESIVAMKLRYFDDVEWLTTWATAQDNLRLPEAVAVELTLLDARENEHVYRTVLSIPSS